VVCGAVGVAGLVIGWAAVEEVVVVVALGLVEAAAVVVREVVVVVVLREGVVVRLVEGSEEVHRVAAAVTGAGVRQVTFVVLPLVVSLLLRLRGRRNVSGVRLLVVDLVDPEDLGKATVVVAPEARVVVTMTGLPRDLGTKTDNDRFVVLFYVSVRLQASRQ
jgi:hypothetical protein